MGLQGRLESPAGVANPGNAHFEYQYTTNYSINLVKFNLGLFDHQDSSVFQESC